MPNVNAGTAQIYGGALGGVNATTSQLYVSTGAAWINNAAFGGADYLLQPGVIVQGSADVLLVSAPALFTPLTVAKAV